MNWINKTINNEYIGKYLDAKFIITIDSSIKKDIHITKGFYGLLDIRYKSQDIMDKNINHAIKKMIHEL